MFFHAFVDGLGTVIRFSEVRERQGFHSNSPSGRGWCAGSLMFSCVEL